MKYPISEESADPAGSDKVNWYQLMTTSKCHWATIEKNWIYSFVFFSLFRILVLENRHIFRQAFWTLSSMFRSQCVQLKSSNCHSSSVGYVPIVVFLPFQIPICWGVLGIWQCSKLHGVDKHAQCCIVRYFETQLTSLLQSSSSSPPSSSSASSSSSSWHVGFLEIIFAHRFWSAAS